MFIQDAFKIYSTGNKMHPRVLQHSIPTTQHPTHALCNNPAMTLYEYLARSSSHRQPIVGNPSFTCLFIT